ncbi:hepcidin-1 [Eucyclogobius newberryi]|uniref:hepcidin-1 n=1 Tax=Eucyclogobius newberryi TaxID=166745 RepID=UPI003B5CBA56
MKAFSIAVAVTLVLAFVCFVESSALPFAGEPEPEEAGSNDTPVAAHQDMSAQSWMMPGPVREKRQSHLSLCRWCCNCCRGNKGCGFCCKF